MFKLLKEKNAFVEAILYMGDEDSTSSNWTKGIYTTFQFHNFDDLPYYQSQLLEPSVNYEISRFTGYSLDDINGLNYSLNGPIKTIKWMLDNLSFVTPVQKLNLTYCLASISKYKLAEYVLNQIDPKSLLIHEQPFYYFQMFVLSNRQNQKEKCEDSFVKIKDIILSKKLKPSLSLFFSSQAIVWYIKTKFISKSLYTWYVTNGLELAKSLSKTEKFGELNSLSVFYRAYAMIPAEENRVNETRSEMEKSYSYASKMTGDHPLLQIIKKDAFKTYYESTLKEQIYVSKDLSKAETTAYKLIEIDPNWSISYQELGDLYCLMGSYELALNEYRKAKKLVLPRFALSLFKEATCLEKMNRKEEAIEIYKELLKFDPLNISSGINGLKLVNELNIKGESFQFFDDKVSYWNEKNLLSDDMKGVLA